MTERLGSFSMYIVLYCIELYCIVLYCIVLYCIVLNCSYLKIHAVEDEVVFVHAIDAAEST